jgi:hypothetical protein
LKTGGNKNKGEWHDGDIEKIVKAGGTLTYETPIWEVRHDMLWDNIYQHINSLAVVGDYGAAGDGYTLNSVRSGELTICRDVR